MEKKIPAKGRDTRVSEVYSLSVSSFPPSRLNRGSNYCTVGRRNKRHGLFYVVCITLCILGLKTWVWWPRLDCRMLSVDYVLRAPRSIQAILASTLVERTEPSLSRST